MRVSRLAGDWTNRYGSVFSHWFVRVLQGDLGYSMLFNAPVASVIKERFATSFALLGGAWLLSGILGTAMGLSRVAT